MPTTNINVAHKLYSDRFIASLQPGVALLRAFSVNLSDEFSKPGDTVSVPLVTPDTAAEWNKTTNNYVRSITDLKARPVVLNKRPIAGFAIDQNQLHNFTPSYWEGKGALNAGEIALYIVRNITALITAANYPDEMVATLTGFSRKKVADLRAKLVKKGMKPELSALCLSPDMYSALLSDLEFYVIGNQDAMRTGVIDNLLGFRNIVEIPTYTGNGFVCHPDAILAASRRIQVADTTPYKSFGSIVEPNTGLALNRVVLTNGPTGETSYSVEALFGCEVGNPDALVRLVETATPAPTP